MFQFPKSSTKTTWSSQAELWGEKGLMPYLGNEALGLCFGMASIWVKDNAPYEVKKLVQSKKDKITKVQIALMENSSTGMAMMWWTATQCIHLAFVKPDNRNYVFKKNVDELLLEVVGGKKAEHHVISFYFRDKNDEEGAHAIGVSLSDTTGSIFDPNYGIGVYESRLLLGSDLEKLIHTYGSPTKANVITIPNDDDFGDFQYGKDEQNF